VRRRRQSPPYRPPDRRFASRRDAPGDIGLPYRLARSAFLEQRRSG
jgi:hypothetical protein